jgi:transposase
MFPPLRSAWALAGRQASVPISGRNDKRVLFGAINILSGYRLSLVRHRSRIEDFAEFLLQLRRQIRGRGIYLLLDNASWHSNKRIIALARQLDIHLLWLPKQMPKLNPMDQLWRHLKLRVAANRQHDTIDELADDALEWLMSLSNDDALAKAAMRSESFWLSHL